MVNMAGFKLVSKQKNVQVFAAGLRDIEKALKAKTYSDPKKKLPKEYDPWLDVFDWTAAEYLPPHQKSQDHAIQLEPKADRLVPEVPWGPLYTMSQNELLVLCNTLNGLLDKGFIHVS